MPKLTLPKNLSQIEIENFKRTNSICTSAEFFAAVKTGDPAIVDRLNFLDEHLDCREPSGIMFDCDDNSCDEIDDGYIGGIVYDLGSPLMHAVRAKNIAMVRYLLNSGANPNDFTSDDGRTALQEAVSTGYIGIVRLLLEKGADPRDRDFGGDEELPVEIARAKGFTAIERTLKYYYHNFFSEHQRVRLDCVAAISNKAPNFYAPLIPNCTQRTEDRPATVAAVRELEQHRNEVVSANIPGR